MKTCPKCDRPLTRHANGADICETCRHTVREIECVSCNKKIISIAKAPDFVPIHDHHCDDRHESAKKTGSSLAELHQSGDLSRKPPYSERLSDGFKLIGEEDQDS